MDLLSEVPGWRVQAEGTSGKFSSYLILLQFANDMSMQDNAQNMVSCCYNRGFYTVCRKANCSSIVHYDNRMAQSRLSLHVQIAVSNVK
jgi:hypothetical protein